MDQVERPGEEADSGWWSGKPPPESSLKAEVPARSEQLGWTAFPSQPQDFFLYIGLMALDTCMYQVLVQGLPSPDRSSTQQTDEGWEKPWHCS